MALTKSTPGEQLILPYGNVRARKPLAAYLTAVPTVGDLVKTDTTIDDGVNRGAVNNVPIGIVVSTNSGNGTLSVALFKAGVQVILDYTGVVARGDKVVCTGAKGTVDTTRDSVKTDNTNGVGTVLALDFPAVGQCVVGGF